LQGVALYYFKFYFEVFVMDKTYILSVVAAWLDANKNSNDDLKHVVWVEGNNGLGPLGDGIVNNWLKFVYVEGMGKDAIDVSLISRCESYIRAVKLWSDLGDVPVDVDAEYIDDDFLHFPKGSELYDVWHWFECKFNVILAVDLMCVAE
jgi:hypothetical protein